MNSDGGLFDVDSSLIAVAHELKSPLSLMRQLALYLDDNLESNELKQIAQQINLTSERGLHLVNDLTKIARLQDAMFELEPINPYKICDEVLYELRTSAKLKHKKLNYTASTKPKLAVANPELLSSVIYNFCDNALHYSDSDYTSQLTVKTAGNCVRVAVRDFGPSLPIKTWRAVKNANVYPQQISSRPGSSGLGLFIAGRFAKVMGANLGAIRHRDGTTFYIDLQKSTQLSLL
ncbi:HAMP domain-containing histidine kinase [Candidatus Saccharibacteria bacterium]|nr:HAMP domain-containing histidine kinase [Candidatus Saccharibacteria bacterium]